MKLLGRGAALKLVAVEIFKSTPESSATCPNDQNDFPKCRAGWECCLRSSETLQQWNRIVSSLLIRTPPAHDSRYSPLFRQSQPIKSTATKSLRGVKFRRSKPRAFVFLPEAIASRQYHHTIRPSADSMDCRAHGQI
jgi:hypothetical protein